MNPRFVQSALNVAYPQVVKEISDSSCSTGTELVSGRYNGSLRPKRRWFNMLHHLLQLWTWGLSVALDDCESRVFDNDPCRRIALAGSSSASREFEPIACLASRDSNRRLARFTLDQMLGSEFGPEFSWNSWDLVVNDVTSSIYMRIGVIAAPGLENQSYRYFTAYGYWET